ncbi:MAG: hypothetical protein IIZ27_05220 [Solobacterium sp.]|nr:hypothetical protein [Solobacterium sp.]
MEVCTENVHGCTACGQILQGVCAYCCGPGTAKAREFELKAAELVFATEDSRNGLAAVIRGEQAEFKGK